MEKFREIDYEKEVKRYRIIVVILLMIMSLIPMLAVLGVFKPEDENISIWFQRSGSLVVLLASTAEYFSFKMYNVFNPEHIANEPLFNTKLNYQLQSRRLMAVSALFIALGTVIWGYGDLLFKNA